VKATVRAKITVHMGTCGIASGAVRFMNALMQGIEEVNVRMFGTPLAAWVSAAGALVTVENVGRTDQYQYMDANK